MGLDDTEGVARPGGVMTAHEQKWQTETQEYCTILGSIVYIA